MKANQGKDAVGSVPGAKSARSVPLYQKVYLSIRSDLESGKWGPSEAMPTERAFADEYSCSLITIRRALDELSRERRVVRIRGKGTFASSNPVDRDLVALSSFTDEMTERRLSPRTVVVSLALAEASPAAAIGLELATGTAVYRLERVRFADESPLLLEEVELPAHMFPGFLEKDVENRSLYDILATDYGKEVTQGREIIEPVLPSKREATLLEQDPCHPAMLIELVSRLVDGTPVEYCRTIARGDRARYHLELRRNKASLAFIRGGVSSTLASETEGYVAL
ncbi:MAG: GntR family transcriptional regulator [Cryobacterium sp.]|nr:GntR family transcriptional regulator [Cryobacterium sp.]